MHEVVDRYCTRYLKSEVLDLPPKLYSKRYFDLTTEQARLYRAVRDDYYAELDSGALLTAPMAITRMLRLQQIASGYLPSDDDEEPRPIGGGNPRLSLLFDVLAETGGHKSIVWAKYRRDIDDIMDALASKRIEAVRYDGKTSETEMGRAKERFKHGNAQVFVSNPAKGGMGLTLTEAKTMIYYNNGFKLVHRNQSEDRFHRLGMEPGRPVNVVDLCARLWDGNEHREIIDSYILDVLRKKSQWAARVHGDNPREWI